MAIGTLRNIWTYPVKALRRLEHESIAVAQDGLAGDRRAAFIVATQEHARAGSTYRGKEDNRFHLLVEPDDARKAAKERGVDLELHSGERYFDARPVSIILDTWIAAVERLVGRELDPLRWRPNFFVRAGAGVELAEADLIGARLALGEVVLQVVKSIERCVTPTYDQVTGESDPTVLRAVAQHRDNRLGIYCEVERTGTVRVGDALNFS